jgi:aryl-alcohol dehydrogenase-like predicted oxidoreductase
MNRREFISGAMATKLALARPASLDPSKIPSYNPKMEYRRLGKTGMHVSAVCMGGHWKRVATMLGGGFKGEGYLQADNDNVNNPAFLKNRDEVITRCMEVGINYVDACAGPEVMAYSKVLKGRRDKIYFGYSWHVRESRFGPYRAAQALIKGLEDGLRESGLEYVDLWRISLPQQMVDDLGELQAIESGAMKAMEQAKRRGLARHTGVSSHNRVWLKSMIETYPDVMDVVLFPYTANSKEMPDDSVFDSVKKHDVGVLGIKPFADNTLFTGDASLNSPHREDDDRRARLAIRYILGNPGITAPIPGLINAHQVDNVVRAIQERRRLDLKERAELERAGRQMWAKLRPNYQWLRQWEYV